eukprot:226365_1
MATQNNQKTKPDITAQSKPNPELRLDIGDFEFTTKLGDGSFSEVFKGSLKKRMSSTHRLHQFGTYFACKLIDRRSITINRQAHQFIGAVLREKKALYECKDIPFVLQLYATAKNDKNIAFITQLCSNGDLLQCLEQNGGFSLNAIRYYAACIVYALDMLHKKCIIHRDIKLENIMLNDRNEPILSDFGCVKLIGDTVEREPIKSDPDFVGTPQFMAPELITIPKSLLSKSPQQILDDANDNDGDQEEDEEAKEKENAEYFNDLDGRLKDEYYRCLDLWSLGCCLYQLRTGNLLFNDATEFLVFKQVKTMNFTLDCIEDKIFKDLLCGLLKEKPMERIGAKDINDLKKHMFFKDIQWDQLPNLAPPPFNDKAVQNKLNNNSVDPQ